VVKSKKEITKTKDFTEINKLLANGYKHFQNEETDSAYYYFNKAKNAAEIKKILQELLILKLDGTNTKTSR
jgi:F0F1-type ATP synthase gamma subunit